MVVDHKRMAARWKARALKFESLHAMLATTMKNTLDDKIYNELKAIHEIRNELLPAVRKLNSAVWDMKKLYEILISDKRA